jgi:hypothetical protein
MNAKEKALELVDKFENYSFIDIEQKISSFYTAKQCALIAVDEMLNSMSIQSTDECQYWEEVRSEIINL